MIPARNAAATIERTLQNLLTAPEIGEILVIDDGSEDNTAARATAPGAPRVQVLPGPGQGIAAALNTGFEAAQGRYVARCDADDTCPGNRFAWQRDWLEAHPAYIAVSAGYQSLTPRGEKVADLAMQGEARDVTADLLAGKTVTSLCTWLIRREALAATGGARSWFETAEDLDLQCRLAAQGPVWHIPRVGYYYWLHDASVTHQQATDRRVFFETQARAFARQRAETGLDDLERGTPPVFTPGRTPRTAPTPVAHQIAGQLTGLAWNCLKNGERAQARRHILRALSNRPFSPAVWRNLILLWIKSLLL